MLGRVFPTPLLLQTSVPLSANKVATMDPSFLFVPGVFSLETYPIQGSSLRRPSLG